VQITFSDVDQIEKESNADAGAPEKSPLCCDYLIEQREHGGMFPHVVDADQGGGALTWTRALNARS
jgi:hypothetical protein